MKQPAIVASLIITALLHQIGPTAAQEAHRPADSKPSSVSGRRVTSVGQTVPLGRSDGGISERTIETLTRQESRDDKIELRICRGC